MWIEILHLALVWPGKAETCLLYTSPSVPARIREGAGFTGNGKDGPEGIFHCAPGRVPSADEAQKGWNGVLRSLSYA